MARSYGQIMSAIWNDPDFRDLTGSAQRTYLMLVTQADISSAGVLALTVGRWSKYARDTPSDDLWDALFELGDKAYTAVDKDTEELLVRKFVKWDGGFTNDKRRQAITSAANACVSVPLRGILAVELDLLSVPHGLSDGAWHTPRVVVTEGDHVPQPSTPILEREPAASDDAEPSRYCSRHPNGTDDKCGSCAGARRRHDAWVASAPERKRREAKARKAEIAGCSHCDSDGWLLNDDGDASAFRCDHLRRTG